MTPGHIDRRVVDRHLIALRQALTALRFEEFAGHVERWLGE